MRFLKTKPHFGRDVPAVALSPSIVDSWMAAADNRTPTEAPSIYDLVALCDRLEASRPIQARSAKKTLCWLMKQADRINQQEKWDHPWRKH